MPLVVKRKVVVRRRPTIWEKIKRYLCRHEWEVGALGARLIGATLGRDLRPQPLFELHRNCTKCGKAEFPLVLLPHKEENWLRQENGWPVDSRGKPLPIVDDETRRFPTEVFEPHSC